MNNNKSQNYTFESQKQSSIQSKDNTHGRTIGIVIALASLLLVMGYVTVGISLPPVSLGSIFEPLPAYKIGAGATNGYVIGSTQTSTLGTIMVAADQSDHFTTVSTGLGPDGKYVFEELKPGKYIVIAYFPDGNYRVIDNVLVQPNSV